MPVAGGAAIQITKNGGNHPMESVEGKSLFFFRQPSPASVQKQDLAGGEAVSLHLTALDERLHEDGNILSPEGLSLDDLEL